MLNAISSTSPICIFHSFLAHFLLFSTQPHTNGWKVGYPFRKNASSAPKGGAKANEQVSSLTRDRPLFEVLCTEHVWVFSVCRSNAHIKSHIMAAVHCVCFPLDDMCQYVSSDACKAITSPRHTDRRRCNVKQRQTEMSYRVKQCQNWQWESKYALAPRCVLKCVRELFQHTLFLRLHVLLSSGPPHCSQHSTDASSFNSFVAVFEPRTVRSHYLLHISNVLFCSNDIIVFALTVNVQIITLICDSCYGLFTAVLQK